MLREISFEYTSCRARLISIVRRVKAFILCDCVQRRLQLHSQRSIQHVVCSTIASKWLCCVWHLEASWLWLRWVRRWGRWQVCWCQSRSPTGARVSAITAPAAAAPFTRHASATAAATAAAAAACRDRKPSPAASTAHQFRTATNHATDATSTTYPSSVACTSLSSWSVSAVFSVPWRVVHSVS